MIRHKIQSTESWMKYEDYLYVRVFILDGSITATNLKTSVLGDIQCEGFRLQLKIKMPKGKLDVSSYYKDPLRKIDAKMAKGFNFNKPAEKAKYYSLMNQRTALNKLQQEEQAVLDDERNNYKDNNTWGFFRLFFAG